MIARSPNHDPKRDKILIDTTGMNKGQAQALEVTEAARDQSADARDSFAGRLLLGDFQPALMMPFPLQSDDDRAIGDEMVASVGAYLAEHLDPEAVDENREIPERVVNGLKDLGVFRMKIPTEYGGLGLSQVNYNRVMMAISSYCGSTAVLVSAHQSIGLPQPLKMCGSEEQRSTYLPRMAAGEISAFALTEPDVGSDPARMRTTATPTPDGEHYILNGVKQWTTNGPIADLMVVMAQTPSASSNGRSRPRITAFIVEGNAPGIETTHRCDFMGLRGIQNGIMTFSDVKVPRANIIWGEGLGLKLALKTLNTGRLTLPAACTGLAKQCLRICREWGNEREQWGYTIGQHEAGQEKVARIASLTFAMEAMTWITSHWADEQRDIRIEAAMAKLFCSEAAWEVVDTTMQFRGGRGYERARSLEQRGERAHPVERMMRDTRINTIIEGTSDIMRLFLAREALDPHLKLAGDLIRKDTPLSVKARAGVGVMAHYAGWYPARAAGRIVGARHAQAGRLAKHMRYIDRTSNKLAQTLFHAMAMNGPKLERKQVLLGELMEIGTALTAMTATCAYALALDESRPGPDEAVHLADVYCRDARRRITERFARLSDSRRNANRLAKGVLDGRFQWMEQGVISTD